MPFCTKCGKSIEPTDKFCRNCGAKQSSTQISNSSPIRKDENSSPSTVQTSTIRNCKACGNIIKPGQKYCSKCLVLVKDPLPSVAPLKQPSSSNRKVFE